MRLLLLPFVGLFACSAAPPSGGETPQSSPSEQLPSEAERLMLPPSDGEGFYCTGSKCLRTLNACEVIRQQDHSGPCERTQEAQCFLAEVAETMTTWQLCSTTLEACEEQRALLQRTKPGYVRYVPCATRR
ncbi:hypothetical protein [Haliangium sp.]|uniref:hypothetical protein n=1 Tax=Haliangium sp. TaxID=2663208 RepID=UPI003D1523DD